MSVGVVVVLAGKAASRNVPGALVAVVLSIGVGYFLDLGARGVALTGSIDGGPPPLGLPEITFAHISQLVPVSLSVSIVILAHSAATSRAYASKYGEVFSMDEDLAGFGLANLSAGRSGTFMVAGNPKKTQVVDSAGGTSQISQVTTGVVVLLVLLFFTGTLQ